MTAPNIAFKVFTDGRSELDRLLVDTARKWLLVREIEQATGLDEARSRRLLSQLGIQLS